MDKGIIYYYTSRYMNVNEAAINASPIFSLEIKTVPLLITSKGGRLFCHITDYPGMK
jgi:hypothetical protein